MVDRVALKQGEIARRAGITRTYLNQILNARQPIRPELAVRLEAVFGISAELLSIMQVQWDLHDVRMRMIQDSHETDE